MLPPRALNVHLRVFDPPHLAINIADFQNPVVGQVQPAA
jgi:hypothetical protein